MPHALSHNTLVPLVLRVTLGVIFVYHGLDKVVSRDNDLGAAWATHMWSEQQKPPKDVRDKLEHWREAADRPDPNLSESENKKRSEERDAAVKLARDQLSRAYVTEAPAEPPGSLRNSSAQLAVAWGELVCGAALLLGMLTRLAALLMIVVQVGAILTVTGVRGFSMASGGGYEYNLALLAMCVAVLLMGGGEASADHFLRERRRGKAAAPTQVPV
jgi:uncharacterized membrane protein YphA (DoxX/SURF4 family)